MVNVSEYHFVKTAGSDIGTLESSHENINFILSLIRLIAIEKTLHPNFEPLQSDVFSAAHFNNEYII